MLVRNLLLTVLLSSFEFLWKAQIITRKEHSVKYNSFWFVF